MNIQKSTALISSNIALYPKGIIYLTNTLDVLQKEYIINSILLADASAKKLFDELSDKNDFGYFLQKYNKTLSILGWILSGEHVSNFTQESICQEESGSLKNFCENFLLDKENEEKKIASNILSFFIKNKVNNENLDPGDYISEITTKHAGSISLELTIIYKISTANKIQKSKTRFSEKEPLENINNDDFKYIKEYYAYNTTTYVLNEKIAKKNIELVNKKAVPLRSALSLCLMTSQPS